MKQNINEIWRDIIGYEDYYEASNLGRIRSLDRTVINSLGRKRFYKGEIMEDSFNKKGYKQVCLSRDNKSRNFKVSQLIAMTFLNHTPNGNTLVVDHINGVKTDNRVENLRIVTNRENVSTCHRKDRNSLSSNFVGVHFDKTSQKYIAQIQFKGKSIYLGLFDSEINASNAYQKALAKLENGIFNPEDYKPKFLSKYKGITFQKTSQKWVARPYINGKQIYLGLFSSELEAHQMILLFESAQPI